MRNRVGEVLASVLVVFLFLVFVTLLALPANAQVSGATLSGTVTDASGAVIPNVQISIKNEATGEVRSVKVDSAGLYSAPNLLPGKYDVTVSAPGFATAIQKDVTLTVGGQQLLNIKMQVGQISQAIEVTDVAPAVQLTDSTVGGVVGQEAVAQLPWNCPARRSFISISAPAFLVATSRTTFA